MTDRVMCVTGTRPEIIKMSPVIHALRRTSWADVVSVASGQHRDLAERAYAEHDLRPDRHLSVMTENQTLSGLTAKLFPAFEQCTKSYAPKLLIAQGDTTTTMVVAMTCFYLGVPFVHLEAGLRSNDLQNPFPEELNRIICGRVATLHLAPTAYARSALLAEGVAPRSIVVTGNTVIDTLLQTTGRYPVQADTSRKLILLTAHRRESFGAPLERTLKTIRDVITSRNDVELLYPVHPNPNVASMAHRIFDGVRHAVLTEPLSYAAFVGAMKAAYLVISDSGGVQEEAPALGKPVLVVRDKTERMEAVNAGVARLVGTNSAQIRSALDELLDDPRAYAAMARGASPYGDGKASARIIDALEVFLGHKSVRTVPDFAPGAEAGEPMVVRS